MRAYEAATAAFLIGIAAVAMYDSRAGALLQPGFTNIPSGFYPFWSAAVIAVGGIVIIVRAVRTPAAVGDAAFLGRQGMQALLKLVLPMVVAVTAMIWLGFYIASGLYLGFFSRYVGRYRWPVVLLFAIVVPTLLYFLFERGFRVPLPKSELYDQGVLPF